MQNPIKLLAVAITFIFMATLQSCEANSSGSTSSTSDPCFTFDCDKVYLDPNTRKMIAEVVVTNVGHQPSNFGNDLIPFVCDSDTGKWLAYYRMDHVPDDVPSKVFHPMTFNNSEVTATLAPNDQHEVRILLEGVYDLSANHNYALVLVQNSSDRQVSTTQFVVPSR